MRTNGFSLAELLLSLLILGLIATFTIPKVLTTQANAQKKAVLKETIAAMNEVFYTGLQQGEITEANFGTYMIQHMNAVKTCTNSKTQGCWNPVTTTPVPGSESQMGIVMHNGVMICGLDDGVVGGGYDMVLLDWNGLSGPNLEGDDIIGLIAVLDNTSVSDRIGVIRGISWLPVSETMWNDLFAN